MQSQIDWLHKNVGSKEWSGPLIYKVHSGDLNTPDDLKIEALGIFLMDVGTAGGTNFEVSAEDTVALYDSYPGLAEGDARIGLIHTHHDMKVYFSGVDDDELKQNAEDYNAYLSLIVGFNMKPVARVAFISEIEKSHQTKINFKSMNDQSHSYKDDNSKKEKVVAYYECDVDIDLPISDSFKQRYNEILKRKEESRKRRKTQYSHGNSYGYPVGGYNNRLPAYNNDGYDYTYSNQEIQRFLCKLVSKNPNTYSRNLWSLLQTYKRTNKTITTEEIINSVDECIDKTFKKQEVDSMTVYDRGELFVESIDFLEASDTKNKSIADTFKLAEQLRLGLTELINLIYEDEVEYDSIGF